MLKFIPEIDSIFILEKGAIDSWGIISGNSVKTEVRCRIKEVENASPIESQSGKQIIPTYDISINGDVGISVGDKVEVYGAIMTVVSRQPKKDLSGKVLYVKYKV